MGNVKKILSLLIVLGVLIFMNACQKVIDTRIISQVNDVRVVGIQFFKRKIFLMIQKQQQTHIILIIQGHKMIIL